MSRGASAGAVSSDRHSRNRPFVVNCEHGAHPWAARSASFGHAAPAPDSLWCPVNGVISGIARNRGFYISLTNFKIKDCRRPSILDGLSVPVLAGIRILASNCPACLLCTTPNLVTQPCKKAPPVGSGAPSGSSWAAGIG